MTTNDDVITKVNKHTTKNTNDMLVCLIVFMMVLFVVNIIFISDEMKETFVQSGEWTRHMYHPLEHQPLQQPCMSRVCPVMTYHHQLEKPYIEYYHPLPTRSNLKPLCEYREFQRGDYVETTQQYEDYVDDKRSGVITKKFPESDIVFVVDAYGTFDYVHTFWFKPICESRQEYATRLLDEADITIEKIDGEWTTVVNFNHDEDNICECREED